MRTQPPGKNSPEQNATSTDNSWSAWLSRSYHYFFPENPYFKGPNSYLDHVINAYKVITLPENLLALFKELSANYSGSTLKPVPFSFFGSQAYFVSDPNHIKAIFQESDNFCRFEKSINRAREVLGYSIVTVPDSEWYNVHKRVGPVLSGKHLGRLSNIMFDVMKEDMLPRWQTAAEQAAPFHISKEMAPYTTSVVYSGFLEIPRAEISDSIHDALNKLFMVIRERLFEPVVLPLWVPTTNSRRFKKNLEIVMNFIMPYLDANRCKDTLGGSVIRAHTVIQTQNVNVARIQQVITEIFPEYTSDIQENISRFLELHTNNEGVLNLKVVDDVISLLKTEISDEDINWDAPRAKLAGTLCEFGECDTEKTIQEIIGMAVAGSETAAVMIMWTWYYLARHPEVQDKIVQEIQTQLKGEINSAEDMIGLSYLNHVLKESLRLRPPVFLNARMTRKDVVMTTTDEKGEEHKLNIPKDTVLFASPYVNQHHTQIWGNDAEEFKPERHAKPSLALGRFFPFGGGMHVCPGQLIAYKEAAIAVALPLANGFRATLTDDTEVQLAPSTTLLPRTDIYLNLSKLVPTITEEKSPRSQNSLFKCKDDLLDEKVNHSSDLRLRGNR